MIDITKKIKDSALRQVARVNTTNDITSLKNKLVDTDYQIIECMESHLLNKTMPYDLAKLSEERQKLRDEINTKETIVK